MCPKEIHFLPFVSVGEQRLTFAELAMQAYRARVSLSATGFYRTPKIEWDKVRMKGRPFFYYAYGAAVSEVAVDTLSGETQLLRVDILHDAGTPLPSPQVNFAPLAVVKIIVPRRMNCPRK